MSPAPDERERITAAMTRILSGCPERSNGALTIVALAQEAGVPRNALTQRHLDLKNQFYEHVRQRGATPDVEIRLRATIATLKKTIASSSRELAQLRTDVPALVRGHQPVVRGEPGTAYSTPAARPQRRPDPPG